MGVCILLIGPWIYMVSVCVFNRRQIRSGERIYDRLRSEQGARNTSSAFRGSRWEGFVLDR